MKKAALKKEYVKLLRVSKTQLKRELKKSTAEQDLDLISECLESVAYCEEELAALRSESASARSYSFAPLRRAGVALLVLVLSFAAFATVSEAAGFRVWTAIIKRDAGYLRVDYVPEPTKAPYDVFDGWEDGEYSFFSIYEFNMRLERDGFDPFVTESGTLVFSEGSVRSTAKDYYASYTLMGEEGSVRVRMIAKAGEPTPVTVWGMNESYPSFDLDIDGIPVTYQIEEDGCIFATWQSEGRIFSASIFEPAEDPARILELIVK